MVMPQPTVNRFTVGTLALTGILLVAAGVHAATDHGLSPLVTNEPAFGLHFMALLVAGAYGRRGRRFAGRRFAAAAG
jgi:hypothetical protein